jgi:hypothetical protein
MRLQNKRVIDSSEVTPYSNASRRTRQRWKAHSNNKCSDKCRFCRKDKVKMAYETAVHEEQSKSTLKILLAHKKARKEKQQRKAQNVKPMAASILTPAMPTKDSPMQHPECKNVLQKEVAYSYVAAAARVSRSKAEAEINQAALTPGMMVWHTFKHQPYVLIRSQEASGYWRVHDAAGNQLDYHPAVLCPVKPSIFVRSWVALSRVAVLAAIVCHNKINSIGWNKGGSTRASIAVGLVVTTLAAWAYLHNYGFSFPQ